MFAINIVQPSGRESQEGTSVPERRGRMILVTGAAGFIGSHLVDRLLADGYSVLGIDNFDPFYAREVKEQNLVRARAHPAFQFHEADVRDAAGLQRAVAGCPIELIVHLAARANVRASFAEPKTFHDVNVNGTRRILELAQATRVERIVLGSSSSVYGLNTRVPWREDEAELNPISPYAQSKLDAESAARIFAIRHGIGVTILRFFNVYGPRQRPDLAIAKFARLLREGEPLPFFGDGSTGRDYTYIGDVVDGIVRAIGHREADCIVFNLGNHRPVTLAELVAALGDVFETKPVIDRQPEQRGDVPRTWANIERAGQILGWQPQTTLKDGLQLYRSWLREQRSQATTKD